MYPDLTYLVIGSYSNYGNKKRFKLAQYRIFSIIKLIIKHH